MRAGGDGCRLTAAPALQAKTSAEPSRSACRRDLSARCGSLNSRISQPVAPLTDARYETHRHAPLDQGSGDKLKSPAGAASEVASLVASGRHEVIENHRAHREEEGILQSIQNHGNPEIPVPELFEFADATQDEAADPCGPVRRPYEHR